MPKRTAPTPIQRAVEIAGGQTALADKIGVKQQRVWKWLTSGRAAPDCCIAIEEAIEGQVTRYELRPDVFGTAPRAAA